MFKSLKEYLVQFLNSLINFLSGVLRKILELLWGVLGPAIQAVLTLLGTIWGRVLATLTLLLSIALSPLVNAVKEALSFVGLLGNSPDVVSSLIGSNFQALCYAAVKFCSLDVLLSSLAAFLLVKAGCYGIRVVVWGSRKVASVVRGAGV